VPVSLWLFFYGLAFLDKRIEVIKYFFKFGYIAIAFIPILTFHFAITFLEKKQIYLRFFLYFGYALSIFFSFFIYFTKLLISGLFLYRWGYYPQATPPYHSLFLLYFNFYYIFATLLLFFGFWRKKDISSIERSKRKYVFFAWLLGSFAALDFVPNYGHTYGVTIFPLGAAFMILTYSIIGYAVIRYRLMDIRIFISRAVAFIIVYTFLLSIPFFFGYRMYPVLCPVLGRHWWLMPVGLLMFFASAAPFAYDQIRRKMEEALLAEQKGYQKLLLQAASGMARERNLNRLSKLIVYIVKRIVKIDFAAIFLDDKEHKAYQLKAIRDSGEGSYASEFLYTDTFVKYLKVSKEPSLYEELPMPIKRGLNFPKRVSLIVPSLIENNLLGFLVLGEKNNREPYSDDDINVFKILTHQAAMAIENCIFFDEFKNAQEKIFNAEKLASIGGMADGVAHQIKNRLNHFSIAAGELKCEIDDFIEKHPDTVKQNLDLTKTFDYLKELATSLIANVMRTDGIIKGILNYARVEEKETFFGQFGFKEIIDVSLELLKIKHETSEFPLQCSFSDGLTLYGVKAQIMESIYNILDNAYEAILDKRNKLSDEEKKSYIPLIKLSIAQSNTTECIEISDNGVGIKEEDTHKIFAPFFTTKSSYKSGTGIGMYVVKRIVEENHRGRIWFETSYMQGTKFVIELPKK
jgi:signal transduction histidine kinase